MFSRRQVLGIFLSTFAKPFNRYVESSFSSPKSSRDDQVPCATTEPFEELAPLLILCYGVQPPRVMTQSPPVSGDGAENHKSRQVCAV
jgi:hypothetical protein